MARTLFDRRQADALCQSRLSRKRWSSSHQIGRLTRHCQSIIEFIQSIDLPMQPFSSGQPSTVQLVLFQGHLPLLKLFVHPSLYAQEGAVQ